MSRRFATAKLSGEMLRKLFGWKPTWDIVGVELHRSGDFVEFHIEGDVPGTGEIVGHFHAEDGLIHGKTWMAKNALSNAANASDKG